MRKYIINNKDMILMVIGVISSWITVTYWDYIAKFIIEIVEVINKQTIKNTLFLANTIVLIFLSIEIFESELSNLIFKFLMVMILLSWIVILIGNIFSCWSSCLNNINNYFRLKFRVVKINFLYHKQ